LEHEEIFEELKQLASQIEGHDWEGSQQLWNSLDYTSDSGDEDMVCRNPPEDQKNTQDLKKTTQRYVKGVMIESDSESTEESPRSKHAKVKKPRNERNEHYRVMDGFLRLAQVENGGVNPSDVLYDQRRDARANSRALSNAYGDTDTQINLDEIQEIQESQESQEIQESRES
jgi:hypothetical protein